MTSSNKMDEIDEQYMRIRLEKGEDGGLVLEDTAEDGARDAIDFRCCLVGKLLSVADFDALMASLWRPGRGMFVKELDLYLFLFQFFHEVDIKRVMEGSPWTFNRIPLIIERLKPGDNPRAVELNKLEMWVQIHDLKFGFMLERVVKEVGNYLGKFVESDM